MVCVTSPRLYNLYAIHRQLSLLQFTNKDTKPVSGHALLKSFWNVTNTKEEVQTFWFSHGNPLGVTHLCTAHHEPLQPQCKPPSMLTLPWRVWTPMPLQTFLQAPIPSETSSHGTAPFTKVLLLSAFPHSPYSPPCTVFPTHPIWCSCSKQVPPHHQWFLM